MEFIRVKVFFFFVGRVDAVVSEDSFFVEVEVVDWENEQGKIYYFD